ncbi:MAG: sugar phosphate isomerase/epimerase [Lentisphaerae bacterium]|nr:sugar phosphate isomerase/epimerase [Lentisphaerota bacterium]
MTLADNLAIQTFTFRGIAEHADVIAATKACGVNKLEMCDCHLSPSAETDWRPAYDLYKSAGIAFASHGVVGIGADEEAARKTFEYAREIGVTSLSADFSEGGLEVAEKLCAEFNIRIGIHNHGREHALGSVAQLDDLFGRTSPNVGLWLDTGWMLDSGEDPAKVADHFRERLYGLHVKDFVFDADGKPEDVIAGTGDLDLASILGYLVSIDFQGPVAIEYEGDEHNPVPAVTQSVQAIRSTLASL